MNKTVLLLATASLALAASTAWLYWQIREERGPVYSSPAREARHDLTATGDAPDLAAARSAAGPDDGISAAAGGARKPTEEKGTPSRGRPDVHARDRVSNEDLLRQYNDPQGRRELIEERVPHLRDQYLTLQRRLGVDALTWQRFLEVLAEEDLGFRAARVDCKATGTCDRISHREELLAESRRRIAEVVGEPNARQIDEFQQSAPERNNLAALQLNLPAGQKMPPERIEAVAAALAQVRNDTAKEMVSAQIGIGVFFDQKGGVLLYDKGPPDADERLASATNYSNLLRGQARKHLPASLMAAYNRQQDSLLEKFRESQKNGGTGAR